VRRRARLDDPKGSRKSRRETNRSAPARFSRDEEANKETVMRLITSIVTVTVLALSSVALGGCATQTTAATRGSDTAVRAETRRISNARPFAAGQLGTDPLNTADRARRATSF